MSATDRGAATRTTRQRTGSPLPARLTDEQRERVKAEVERWPDPPASVLNYVSLVMSSTSGKEAA